MPGAESPVTWRVGGLSKQGSLKGSLKGSLRDL